MSLRERRAAVAAAVAGVVLTALTAAGCGIDPEVRVESPAGKGTETPAGARMAVSRPSEIDGMPVLRDDPRVSREVISAIPRCQAGRFPVVTREISLRGEAGAVRLLSVTIYSCPGRSCGYEGTRGTYVYQLTKSGPGERVYAHEGVGSRVEVRDGALVLVRPDYRPGDAASCPTATRSAPLRWTGHALVLAGE
ncbi:hypothetical protein HNP84_001753 [Thermocatellispora tengchongensis]|uniref:Uncharacterized protein n=1 Tax=Thermocatellispora tengchongensis TaxID=1073253 RepID=A0A840P3I9_9ACTN|nr:hypothetical protein [Thermocatellispora tengchongensis]MBB5132040.1 hypothetical protein [Thermocatellispora tengchongensis]